MIIRNVVTLVSFVSLSFLFGCKSAKQEISLKVVKNIKLNVSYKDINNKIGFGTYNDGLNSGFYFADQKHEITFFENGIVKMKKQILSESINMDGLAYDSAKDDLYWTVSNQIYCLNSSNLSTQISFTPPKGFLLESLSSDIQPKAINGSIYLNIVDPIPVANTKSGYKSYCKNPSLINCSVQKGKIDFVRLLGEFPENYRMGKNYNNYFCNIETDGENILVSYTGNDSLFVYEKKDKQLKKYFLGSENIKNEIEPISFDDLIINSRVRKYNSNAAKYIKLIYDPYNKQYLRVYQLKNSEESSTVTKWGVAFYSKDFELIRDVVFDSKQYIYLLVSPSKEGLIVSKALKDYSNDKIEMDILRFD